MPAVNRGHVKESVAACSTYGLDDDPRFEGLFGYAAEPISKKLKNKGAEIVITPTGFCVNDTEGPLKEGELERATTWANQIIKKLETTIY